MDLSIYLKMISAVWYLVPIAMVVTIIKSAWFKGLFGEWQVNLLIRLYLDKNDYHLIKSVTLPTEDGTTQIDHIIISKFGIFVVETKNMKGWIFGSEHQNLWTQQIFQQKSIFQNPIHQNYKHVKTLESCLNTSSDNIFSVIVFVGDSTFKTKMPDNVRFARGGIEYIKSKTDIVYNVQEITYFIEQIEGGKLQRSYKTNRQHVKYVNGIVKKKFETKACSKCGADMVLRKANKGKNAGNQFWGCRSFPKCRNTIELDATS